MPLHKKTKNPALREVLRDLLSNDHVQGKKLKNLNEDWADVTGNAE